MITDLGFFDDTEEVRICAHFLSHFTLQKIAIRRRRFILVDISSIFRSAMELGATL
jgi:hypothetical protein